jgi:predicted metalloprotease
VKRERTQFREFLETGDIEEALRAASAIGDDRLQKKSRGYVVPESFNAWLCGPAHAMVQDRSRAGNDFRLQHVRPR